MTARLHRPIVATATITHATANRAAAIDSVEQHVGVNDHVPRSS
jgi:hypothetical protein